MSLAVLNSANGTGILCTVLLIATIIAFILGLAEVLGFYSIGARTGRFGSLIVAVILLVVYLVVC